MPHPTIVILYFETSIRDILRHVLEMEDYHVQTTIDPDKALALLDASACGVLLADNYTVSPYARRALPALKEQHDLRARVRVIGLTAHTGEDVEQTVTSGLIDAILPLPFLPEQLLAMVQGAVQGR